MRITNSEVIKNGEQELIDAITSDLDWGTIEDIFREKHHLDIEENVEYKRGDIVVHNHQIAYKLDFEVKVTVSILLDREGSYISVSMSADPEKTSERDGGGLPEEAPVESAQSITHQDDVPAEDEEESEGLDMGRSTSEDDGSEASIAQMASQAGKIIKEMK